MQTKFIIAAALSAFAPAASALPIEPPFALSATHADFLAQLEDAAAVPGEIGTTARAAVDLLRLHIATEDRVMLPILALAETLAEGESTSDPQMPAKLESLALELPGMRDAEIEVIGALVDLFEAANAEGRPDISRLADTVILHEILDHDVLYPAALLIAASARGR